MVRRALSICYPLPSGKYSLDERIKKMKKLSVKFQVLVNEDETTNFEYFLNDLLVSSVLPALSAQLVPLTLETKKARK